MTTEFDCGLNRDLEVTDTGKSARGKRTIRCQEAALKSVWRELSRLALAANPGPVYRLRRNRCVQACNFREAGAI